MEIVSKPAILDIPVILFEIAYVGGGYDSITLIDGDDTYEILAENIFFKIKNLDEVCIVERRNVRSFRYRKGVVQRLVPPSGASENSQSPLV